MATLSEYTTALLATVPPLADLSDGLLQPKDIVARALLTLSRDVPRETVATITGDGTSSYELGTTGPDQAPDWVAGFSAVMRPGIEYPLESDRADRQILDDASWYIDHQAGADHLVFNYDTPASTETFRLRHTLHWGTATADLPPDEMTEGVVHLLAARACEILAAKSLSQGAPDLLAQFGNDGRHPSYTSLANHHRKRYQEFFGLGADGKRAGGMATKRYDSRDSKGRRRLFHGRGSIVRIRGH